MSVYKITYETADGTVEDFSTETSKTRAQKMARACAKVSVLNGVFGVTRWFVECGDMTVSTHPVAA